MTPALHLSPIQRWGNWATEKPTIMLQVIEHRNGIRTQAVRLHRPCSNGDKLSPPTAQLTSLPYISKTEASGFNGKKTKTEQNSIEITW